MKRQFQQIIHDSIEGIGKSDLVADAAVQYGGQSRSRIDVEVSGGQGQDALRVLILPSLWSIYAWLGASQRGSNRQVKNGLDISEGNFVAETRIEYQGTQVVFVIQHGLGLNQGTLHLKTRVEGRLPQYDLSDPNSIKHNDPTITLLKVNSTSYFGRAKRSLTIREKSFFYTQETTLTIESRSIKRSGNLFVLHSSLRRTVVKGKVHILVEAEIERASKSRMCFHTHHVCLLVMIVVVYRCVNSML